MRTGKTGYIPAEFVRFMQEIRSQPSHPNPELLPPVPERPEEFNDNEMTPPIPPRPSS